MKKRVVILSLMLLGAATASASAGGSKEQDDACRPDVRRYCHQVHPEDGDNAYLACLQENRAKLSVKCRAVLEDNGV